MPRPDGSAAPSPSAHDDTTRRTTQVVVASSAGGPEVLHAEQRPVPVPGAGQVLVRTAAVGVNFIDVYRRSGVYPMNYPGVLGSEGSGTVEATAPDVTDIKVGDRVAWSQAPASYAQHVAVDADQTLPVPADVDLVLAAALPLQGLTAHYLATSTYPVQPGDTVLVHAGAGGVGLLLTQLAVARGARVISTVSTPEKETLSREAGAEHVINYRELDDLTRDLPRLVRDLTDGHGVQAAYDSVGRDTFDASLASLAKRGMLVLFGGSSGQVPPVDPQRLNAAGSVFLTRPTLGDYVATREELLRRAEELFAATADGTLSVRVGQTFALADAAAAHAALEGRLTTGKVLLLPPATLVG